MNLYMNYLLYIKLNFYFLIEIFREDEQKSIQWFFGTRSLSALITPLSSPIFLKQLLGSIIHFLCISKIDWYTTSYVFSKYDFSPPISLWIDLPSKTIIYRIYMIVAKILRDLKDYLYYTWLLPKKIK
jgi:hypothetical protein